MTDKAAAAPITLDGTARVSVSTVWKVLGAFLAGLVLAVPALLAVSNSMGTISDADTKRALRDLPAFMTSTVEQQGETRQALYELKAQMGQLGPFIEKTEAFMGSGERYSQHDAELDRYKQKNEILQQLLQERSSIEALVASERTQTDAKIAAERIARQTAIETINRTIADLTPDDWERRIENVENRCIQLVNSIDRVLVYLGLKSPAADS